MKTIVWTLAFVVCLAAGDLRAYTPAETNDVVRTELQRLLEVSLGRGAEVPEVGGEVRVPGGSAGLTSPRERRRMVVLSSVSKFIAIIIMKNGGGLFNCERFVLDISRADLLY